MKVYHSQVISFICTKTGNVLQMKSKLLWLCFYLHPLSLIFQFALRFEDDHDHVSSMDNEKSLNLNTATSEVFQSTHF